MPEKKNALAELAEDLEILKVILENEHHPKGLQVADKAQRIVAELAKVEDWTNDYGAEEPMPYSSVSAIKESRAIAEEGAV